MSSSSSVVALARGRLRDLLHRTRGRTWPPLRRHETNTVGVGHRARSRLLMAQQRTMKKPLATEHALQCSLIDYLDLTARPNVYYFAIPNAGKRTPYAGAQMRAEGLRAGVADLIFMLPDGRCCWLELKRSPRQKQSIEQNYF